MITYPSYTFEPIDGWFQYEEFDQRFFDEESLVPFAAGTSNNGNEMAGANLMSDDLCMKESMELDFNQILIEENLMQDQNQPSSSLSSKLTTPSIDGSSNNSSTQIFRSDSISSTSISKSKTSSILQPGSRSLTCSIPSSCDDEDAITKAMVAVISSVNSSASSSSSPSIISHNNYSPKFGELGAKSGVFRPFYNSDLSPKHEVINDGQSLIKRSLAMLRSIKPAAVEHDQPKAGNLHHMISERRRREKLNASYDMLRMLLPPGSKKDKTSVLIKAASYLKSLESQISEMQEKTLKLESYLPNATGGNKDATIGSNERVQIQILTTSCSDQPQVQQINLRINVVQECDVVGLVLRVLECLKGMEIARLVSVDAYTFSPRMKLRAKASIKLRVKESKWNEALFRQAIEKAVDDVITTMCPKPSRLHKL